MRKAGTVILAFICFLISISVFVGAVFAGSASNWDKHWMDTAAVVVFLGVFSLLFFLVSALLVRSLGLGQAADISNLDSNRIFRLRHTLVAENGRFLYVLQDAGDRMFFVVGPAGDPVFQGDDPTYVRVFEKGDGPTNLVICKWGAPETSPPAEQYQGENQ